ncbi:MAG: hypothetical protein JKX92_12340 [Porticoccaceae bacterium]|nr:hypothetical protein [Porticoccaceae bacterium]
MSGMKLKKLTRGERNVIESFACSMVANDLAKNVDGMERFAEFFKNRERPKAKHYKEELQKEVLRVREALMLAMKTENEPESMT